MVRPYDGDFQDDLPDNAVETTVIYTNAPEIYDYETTVVSSQQVPGHTSFKDMNHQRPFRRVNLDIREDRYYATYQCNRYRSGGYLVMTPDTWDSWVHDGFIVIPSAANEPMS